MFTWLKRRWLCLDAPVAQDELRWDAWPAVREALRELLRTMLAEGHQALYLFFHEADGVVRSVLWHPEPAPAGVWYEAVPMAGEAGQRLMRELRTRVRRRRRRHSAIWGVFPCVWGGRKRELLFMSPHEWEVRFFVGPSPPPRLPYVLVHAEVRAGEHDAGKSCEG